MTFKRIIQWAAVSGAILAGLWAAIKYLPCPHNHIIDNVWAASQIYPKDNTSFINIPFYFRGASVKDTNLTAPPGSPSEGDRYIVGSVATDTWAGKETQIAEYHARSGGTATWYYTDPWRGLSSWCEADSILYIYNGASWTTSSSAIGTLAHSSLTNLSYASAGHTGFEPTVTKGNLTTGTAGVTVTGGSSAVIGSGTTLNIATATGSDSGLLSNTDWSTFNGKQDALTFIHPIVNSGGSVSMDQATTSDSGFLSAIDWNTFNDKAEAAHTHVAADITDLDNSYATDTALAAEAAQLRAEAATDTELEDAIAATEAQLRAEAATDTELAAEAAQLRAEMATDTELAGKEPTISAGAVSQYWRGDKSWQTLNLDALADVLASGAAQGDILYFDTDSWKLLTAGDSGKFLKTQGAAANPIWDTPAGSGDMLKADYATQDANIVDTAFQIEIPSQATGDVLYYDGEEWVRLAADAGKYLKSGASAPSWDTPAGSGDMTKADYATQDANRVDSAMAVDDGAGNVMTPTGTTATTFTVGSGSPATGTFNFAFGNEAANADTQVGKLGYRLYIGALQYCNGLDETWLAMGTGDTYNKLLLHCDDAAVGDFSLTNPKTVVPTDITVSDTESKFGGASASFNGTTSLITITDDTDFALGTSNFTIDFWVKFIELPQTLIPLYSQLSSSATSTIQIYYRAITGSKRLDFQVCINSVSLCFYQAPVVLSTDTWYHVAVVRNGANLKIFLNGVALSLTEIDVITAETDLGDVVGDVVIGTDVAIGTFLNGYLDEYRFSKGVVRWTVNFDPPARAYPY